MQVQVRKLEGSWDLGYALHKHTLSSVYLGDDEYGHARFDTTRSEAGPESIRNKFLSCVNELALDRTAFAFPPIAGWRLRVA